MCASVAPGVAEQQATTMRRVLDSAIGPARQVVALQSFLTALALMFGAVGSYGVIAYFAARRRREWAIRVALGLSGSRVVMRVAGHCGALVTARVGIGVLSAAVLAGMTDPAMVSRDP